MASEATLASPMRAPATPASTASRRRWKQRLGEGCGTASHRCRRSRRSRRCRRRQSRNRRSRCHRSLRFLLPSSSSRPAPSRWPCRSRAWAWGGTAWARRSSGSRCRWLRFRSLRCWGAPARCPGRRRSAPRASGGRGTAGSLGTCTRSTRRPPCARGSVFVFFKRGKEGGGRGRTRRRTREGESVSDKQEVGFAAPGALSAASSRSSRQCSLSRRNCHHQLDRNRLKRSRARVLLHQLTCFLLT